MKKGNQKRNMLKFLQTKIISVWILCCITSSMSSQQRKWILPYKPATNQTFIPSIDFSGQNPQFIAQPLTNYYSSQTVGNGEYCNNCSDEADLISDFFITGRFMDFYNSPTIGNPELYALQMTWDRTCGTSGIQEVLNADECSSSPELSHESLAEIAVGEGESPGTFWIVLQNAGPNYVAHAGAGMYVYHVDMNNASLCGNTIQNINTVIPDVTFNEGVALGPRFIYDLQPNVTDPVLIAQDGRWTRSIYCASNDGNTYHVLLDLATGTLLNYFDAISNNNFDNRVLEIELSFPQHYAEHPDYLANTGWAGVDLMSLGVNGELLSNTIITNDRGGYGVEFDQFDNYLYYSRNAHNDSPTLWRYDLNTPANSMQVTNQIFGFEPGRWNNLAMESAIDGNIYLITTNGEFYVLTDPEFPMVNLSADINLAAQYQGLFDTPDFGFGLPDWVDGEIPLSVDGGTIEICVDQIGCDEDEQQLVEVFTDGLLIQTYLLWPGECEEVNVCPGKNYDVIINNGDYMQTIYIASANAYHPVNYTAGPGGTNANGYFNYAVNTTINSDILWDDKVFIEDQVIITITDGAILDITNVDVIFGECAGLKFEKGAMIRANNSVFRPCDPYSVWRGIEFDIHENGQDLIPDGWFNECTFKNAKTGVFFSGEPTWRDSDLYNNDTKVKITNNLFSNCQIGIAGRHGRLTESITGNTFYHNDEIPDFLLWDCKDWIVDNRRAGILSWDVDFEGAISQNDFIYADEDIIANEGSYGIDLGQPYHAQITNNVFTNIEHAIQIRNAYWGNVSIEGNDINIDTRLPDNNAQITVIRANGVEVTGNEVKNTNESTPSIPTFTKTGIYIANARNVLVKENYVMGFESAFQTLHAEDVYIISNEVKNAWYYGVYSEASRFVDISCNIIDMDMTAERSSVGVGYFQTNFGNNHIYIRNNCIYETQTGIYLEAGSISSDAVIPLIKNNLLYNYDLYGIENINFHGNIGSGINTSAKAGSNTFSSNNFNTNDINTNMTMTVYGCYGITNTSSSVTLNGNNLYNSTASCGGQIESNNNLYGESEICDHVSLPNSGFTGEHVLEPHFTDDILIGVRDPQHLSTDKISYKDASSLFLYPIPTYDRLKLRLKDIEENTSIMVLNAVGEVVRIDKLMQGSGLHHMDVSDLTSGVYFIQINDQNHNKITEKFVKI